MSQHHGITAYVNLCRQIEKTLWTTLSQIEMTSMQDCQFSPLNGLGLRCLKKAFTKGLLPEVGIIPFDVQTIIPTTAPAHNSACQSLREALIWSSNQPVNEIKVEDSPLINFTRIYLRGALDLSKQHPIGASICFGIDLQSAQLMHKSSIDRLTIEIFLTHFRIHFLFLGEDPQLHDFCQDPVQIAFVDWMMAPPKLKHRERSKFLRKVSRAKGSLRQPNSFTSLTGINKSCDSILALCAELGIALPSAQRFMQLFGLTPEDAYNKARRYLRQNPPLNSPAYLPRTDKAELMIQICKALLERTVDASLSPSILIEAFFWASLLTIQITRVGTIEGHEGFWITWLEKKLKSHLQKIVHHYCGENSTLSAKNNLIGERHDSV